jgi:transposase-like protein
VNNARDTFGELRGTFDSSDPFMTGGHQIIKTREGKRKIPLWVKDQKFIQNLLLRSFPKLATSPTQRSRAARWARVIYLYYRANMTASQVASEMKIDIKTVYNTLGRAKTAAKGNRTSKPKIKLGIRPRGRPRK